jgi:hypothetical protein
MYVNSMAGLEDRISVAVRDIIETINTELGGEISMCTRSRCSSPRDRTTSWS